MSRLAEQLRYVRESAGAYVTSDHVVHVRGEDARSWLNGQVTNDIREVGAKEAAYALVATIKGRIVSDLWVVQENEDGLAIVLPSARFESAFELLDKHVIMEDVELAQDERLRVVTVQGPRAQDVARELGKRVYASARLPEGGVDVWVSESELADVVAELAARAVALGGGLLDAQGWTNVHVALGVPLFGVDFAEDTYPQEAGLKGRALSFSKGCYRGQEVIYMLENRGQLARRLVVLELPAGSAVSAGAVVEADGKRVGELTSVTVASEGEEPTLAMAFVKRPLAELGQSVNVAGAAAVVRRVVGVTDDACPLVAG